MDERKKYMRVVKTRQSNITGKMVYIYIYTFPLLLEHVPFPKIKPGRAKDGCQNRINTRHAVPTL